MNNKNKSIVIDGRNLSLENGTGIATYARNLSYLLNDMGFDINVLYGKPKLPGKSDFIKEISFFDIQKKKPALLTGLGLAKQLITSPFGESAKKIPITGKVIADNYKDKLPYFDTLWNIPSLFDIAHIYFSIYKRLYPVYFPNTPDIAHWTYPAPIWAVGAKNIYTIHDIVPLRLPYTTRDNKANFLRLINTIIKKSDHICTVSEHSKQDLIDVLQAPESKITNTYQTAKIPEKYLSCDIIDVITDISGAYGLKHKDYFLFFGAIEPKKNVGRIIEAFLSSDVKSPLILASGSGWMSKPELRMILDDNHISNSEDDCKINNSGKIMKIDHVPFRLLVSLIRGAKAVLFPSMYEGFGLPILESMLCGTPVITSNFGAMKETAGDAALFVDPYNVREIRDAIKSLDSNQELRMQLSEKGLVRAEIFNQLRYKEKLSNMYENIM